MARAYRKKPVTVEAVQWTGENHAEMCEFIDPEVFEIFPRVGLVIHTLEGDHHASPGDYIIKGVNGEFYPCKPDIFAKTYESATLTPPNEPLTLEQLRKMDGKPVLCVSKIEDGVSEWMIVDAMMSVCEGKNYIADFKELGSLWLAYAYQPAHIDREGWVSVEERLPEDEKDGETVLVIVFGKPHENITLHGAIMTAGYFRDEGWVLNEYPEWEGPEVTHWMPLPKPPKEG